MWKKKLKFAAAPLACGVVFTGAADAQVFFDRDPGSALVYPLFDVNNNAGTAKTTTLKLSNLGTANVWVHLIRVCGGIKSFGGKGLCQASDRVVKLTPRETFVRDVASYFGIDRTNCPTGFIVAFAQATQFDTTPIQWDFLIGSTHINGSGPLNQRTAAMQAYGFQVPQNENSMPGLPIAGGQGGAFPVLPFDGVGYRAPATVYHTDFLATAGTRWSELSLLTLDIQAGAQNWPTLVGLDWNNQGEEPFSGAIEYVCHVRVRLDDEVNAAQPGAGVQGGNNFVAAQLGSAYGVLTMTPFDNQPIGSSQPAVIGNPAILGTIVEVGQNRLTQRGLWHDRNDRPTVFTGN